MSTEFSEINEKLEKIESNSLENINEVQPLEYQSDTDKAIEGIQEYSISFQGSCICSGRCGSNYNSTGGKCICSGNCGSNYSH